MRYYDISEGEVGTCEGEYNTISKIRMDPYTDTGDFYAIIRSEDNVPQVVRGHCALGVTKVVAGFDNATYDNILPLKDDLLVSLVTKPSSGAGGSYLVRLNKQLTFSGSVFTHLDKALVSEEDYPGLTGIELDYTEVDPSANAPDLPGYDNEQSESNIEGKILALLNNVSIGTNNNTAPTSMKLFNNDTTDISSAISIDKRQWNGKDLDYMGKIAYQVFYAKTLNTGNLEIHDSSGPLYELPFTQEGKRHPVTYVTDHYVDGPAGQGSWNRAYEVEYNFNLRMFYILDTQNHAIRALVIDESTLGELYREACESDPFGKYKGYCKFVQ